MILIDAYKLIKAIKEYFKGEVDKIPKTMECGAAFDYWNIILEHNQGVLKVIKSQPTVNQWIPCSERLPEVEENTEDCDCPEFNVTFSTGVVSTLKFTSDENTWFDEFGNVYTNVIAWQPLPQPYESLQKGSK